MNFTVNIYWKRQNRSSLFPQGLIPLATLGLALSGSLTSDVQSSGEQSRNNLDRAEAYIKSEIHSFSKKFKGYDQHLA